MLQLKNIVKVYTTGETTLTALKSVSLSFRKSEFVAILGPSGCGKTTMLNIIGGLDQYTSGDLVIKGRSTKEYKDSDWDSYRNHSIGFVFQSYNLISHQSILSNVELALTLSGVSKQERKRRATEALEKVGLIEHINKRPNQLSGGQMQRVAIARALVNNPDILLADEPTGALDSETSIQIMNILNEISKDKLIIMVTHNPELAEKYATRTINLLDGTVVGDSNPYVSNTRYEEKEITKQKKTKVEKTRSMSFFTALGLSLNNLLTKKGRTILTAFAGSIGIIGIALIQSVSTGVNNYIDSIEKSTMASYPIVIEESAFDMTSLIDDSQNANEEKPVIIDGCVTSNNMMTTIFDSIYNMVTKNNLKDFKKYIEDNPEKIKDYATDIKYSYNTNLNTYLKKTDNTGKTVYQKTYSDYTELYQIIAGGDYVSSNVSMGGSFSSMGGGSIFSEMIGDQSLFEENYDYIYGHFPTNKNELILVVNKNHQVVDYLLYCLGIMDVNDLAKYQQEMEKHNLNPDTVPQPTLPQTRIFSYEDLCNYEFSIMLDSDYYEIKDDDVISHKNVEMDEYIKSVLSSTSNTLKIAGICVPAEGSTGTTANQILYLPSLMPDLITQINNSEIVNLQKNNEDVNVIDNIPFIKEYNKTSVIELLSSFISGSEVNDDALEKILSKNISSSDMLRLTQMFKNPSMIMSPDNLDFLVYFANKYLVQTKEDVMKELGYVDFDVPSRISIYPKDFEAKESISSAISSYNSTKDKDNQITYSDIVGILLSSVTVIVNAISYVLISFVSISLIVSSIMIGIITYISVLERTKEIGILRSIGASKKDVSRVFNAESIAIGFTSGAFGILLSLLLTIPINLILYKLTSIPNLKASLPFVWIFILIGVSVILTFIAGLIPSGLAAKKDPVIALRTE